jgi:hypothetical protein
MFFFILPFGSLENKSKVFEIIPQDIKGNHCEMMVLVCFCMLTNFTHSYDILGAGMLWKPKKARKFVKICVEECFDKVLNEEF